MILATFLAGSIFTLVIPLVFLIVVAIWYVLLWRSGSWER
jgi:phosphotransferase system  glucose/maltose/N-acetylglucosamine-specific IIC component